MLKEHDGHEKMHFRLRKTSGLCLEAKLAMEVVQPVLLATYLSTGYWHSAFHIDSVRSLKWHILMDTPDKASCSGTEWLVNSSEELLWSCLCKRTVLVGSRSFLRRFLSEFVWEHRQNKDIFVNYRSLELKGSPFLKLDSMGWKRHLSISSRSAAAKLSDTQSIEEPKTQETVLKENVIRNEILGDDLENVEKMTFQQLRSRLRNMGTPAKGTKQELVSALKSTLNGQVDGIDENGSFDIIRQSRLGCCLEQ